MADIIFEDVSRVFPARDGKGEVAALRGVDLRIREGELVVIVGPSGSGKSTLLDLLAGLDAPSSGRIL